MSVQSSVKQSVLHKSLTEAVAGTAKIEAIEVPNSQNARLVKIDRIAFDIELPENVAATLTEVVVAAAVGDIVAAMTASPSDLSVAGTFAVPHARRYVTDIFPYQSEWFPNRIITPATDGKRYITLGIKGVSNVNVKNVKITAEFTVL